MTLSQNDYYGITWYQNCNHVYYSYDTYVARLPQYDSGKSHADIQYVIMLITVHVNAHAKRNLVTKLGPTEYKVWVNVAPEHGKANKKVTALLADFLAIAPTSLELRSGATKRIKIFSVT